MPLSATRSGNGVVVTFNKPLQTLSSSVAVGFELCGAVAANCRFTTAHVHGNSVELEGDGGPVTRVRYAWADYPMVNLYDLDQLPVPVFELPVQ
jgi:sialate O-acetylesterase